MKYSKSIDRAALSVARRMFKGMQTSESEGSVNFSVNRNPLFYPCVVALTAVAFWIVSPLASVLTQATQEWLPSPVIAWAILILCAYPIGRFCTMLLALRTR
jgi:hypothetical protein